MSIVSRILLYILVIISTYLVRDLMSDGVYGGNDAIVAFARYYNCTVVIHQPNSPKWEVHGCIDSTQAMQQRCFHIAYLNGEHYCSVVPVDSSTENDPCSSRPHKSSHEVHVICLHVLY